MARLARRLVLLSGKADEKPVSRKTYAV
jgi:hypothetical protein